jgi:hypothetical protein
MSAVIKSTYIYLLFAFAVTGIAFAGLGGTSSVHAQNQSTDCILEFNERADVFNYARNDTLEFSNFTKTGGEAAITVTNKSDCQLPLTLGSYEMPESGVLSEQTLYADSSITLQPGDTSTLKVSLPSCMSQIDLLSAPDMDSAPENPRSSNTDLIGFTYYGNEKDVFAENDIFHYAGDSPLDEFPDDEDDRPEVAQPAQGFYFCDATALTVKKKVENTDDSNVSPSDFTINATPHESNSPSYSFGGSEDGVTRDVASTRYNLTETGPDTIDYTTSYSGDCQARSDGPGAHVTPESYDTTCTITNTIQPDDNTCPHPNNQLPIEELADVSKYALDGTLEFSSFEKNNGNAAITVTNNSNCKLPLALGVYEMYDSNFSDQELFSQDQTKTSGNGDTATLASELPSCMAQIDLLYNADGNNPPQTPSSANSDVIGFTFNQNDNDTFAENDLFHRAADSPLDTFPNDQDDRPENAGPESNFCSDDPDPDPKPAEATFVKAVNNENGSNFQPNDFTITLNQKNGPTKYEFRGSKNGNTITDMATGTYQITESTDTDANYSTDYSSTCTSGEITIESGDNVTCQMTNDISYNPTQPLSGSCDVTPSDVETGETVTWDASGNGGDSPYTYSWNLENKGDDISGQTVMSNYSSEGSFDGTVTISDQNGESITRTCTVSVEDEDTDGGDDSDDDNGSGGGGGFLPPRDDDDDDDGGDVAGTQDPEFSVQCQPEKSTYRVGEPVTFTADIDGIDTNEADFRWAATEGQNLEYDQTTATIQFTTPGQKQVGVRVDYENEYETAKCSVSIRSAQTGVTLDQVPYTGPSDNPIAFFALLMLTASVGGYLAVRQLRNDEVHVGIPRDHKS